MKCSPAVLEKLEFDKVVHRIASLAASEPGKAMARGILPLANLNDVSRALALVDEAKRLLIEEGSIPLEEIRDIRPSLKKCLIENSVLLPLELQGIAMTLGSSRKMHILLGKRHADIPTLAAFKDDLVIDKILEFNIGEAVDDSGGVKDSASKELRAIRSDTIAAEQHLRKRLEQILRRVSKQEFLQDEIITTRDGRMVIPIKTEFKKQVPGFIHSSSASGATMFIEPAETLELNNELRELQLREEREIQRILQELTGQVRELREPLDRAFRALVELDVLFAKARYSIEILGYAPALAERPLLRLRDARHPVLLGRLRREEVVPLNIEMGESSTTLVITGPNAGGKSVALKTSGLLCLLTQAGVHIPAAPDSEVFLFERIFVDIGDEQSIENDLSTFSSHLVNIQEVLSEATPESLVLLDELGAGTDPEEGAVLGMAVLEELTNRSCLTIVTTHSGKLKIFAHERPRMVNGSMEFDQRHLQPTYRFQMGMPGSSYALELAERLRLPKAVLDRARRLLGPEKIKLESLIAELSAQTQQARATLLATEAEKDRLSRLVEEYESKLAGARREMREMKRQAASDAQDLVNKAQAAVEKAIREIREQSASKDAVRGAKASLSAIREEAQQETPLPEQAPVEPIQAGDEVRLREGSGVGEVESVKDGYAVVLWKHGSLRVPVGKLMKADGRKVGIADGPVLDYDVPTGHTIDLRGMTGDEAEQKTAEFLENAYVAGLHRVDIIHGKGTGALRKRIGTLLKKHTRVRSFRLGEWNEGGSGVTVVELTDS